MDFKNRCCHNNHMNSEDEKNDCETCSYNHDNKKSNCCVRRVEETFCCFPSYYNEDTKEEKKDNCNEEKEEKNFACYEGTFKFYPSYCDNKKYKEYHVNNYKCEDKKCCKDDDNKTDKRDNSNKNCCRTRCCLCNLFGNCRRW